MGLNILLFWYKKLIYPWGGTSSQTAGACVASEKGGGARTKNAETFYDITKTMYVTAQAARNFQKNGHKIHNF